MSCDDDDDDDAEAEEVSVCRFRSYSVLVEALESVNEVKRSYEILCVVKHCENGVVMEWRERSVVIEHCDPRVVW